MVDLVILVLTLLGTVAVSFTAIRSTALNFADFIYILAAILVLLNPGLMLRSMSRVQLYIIMGGLISLGSLLTLFQTQILGDIVAPFKFFISSAVIYVLFAAVVRTLDRWKAVAAAFVVGVAVNCIDAILQVALPGRFHADCMTQGRACGFTDHPNDLGYLICAGIFTTLALVPLFDKRVKLVLFAVLGLECSGLAATGSMGSAVGVLAGLGFYTLGSFRLRPKKTGASLVAGLLAGLLLLPVIIIVAMNTQLGHRFADFFGQSNASSISDTTLGERFITYDLAFRLIKQTPFAGVGMYHGPGSMVPHNVFIGIWYECGVLGLIGILTILLYTAYSSTRTFLGRWTSIKPAYAALAVAAGIFGLLICAQIAPFGYRRAAWAPFWLAATFTLLWAPTAGRAAVATARAYAGKGPWRPSGAHGHSPRPLGGAR